MQIRTTSDMKIRKASGSKISKGGTVLKFGEEMIFGTSRRASGGINSLNASFYADENRQSDDNDMSGNDGNGNVNDIRSVLKDDGKYIFSSLSKRDRRKYERYYKNQMSKQQWTASGNFILKRGGSAPAKKTGTMVSNTAGNTINKSVNAAAKTTAKTMKTAAKTTVETAAEAATLGAAAVAAKTADVAIATSKAAVQAAKKTTDRMQQQVSQGISEREAVSTQQASAVINTEEMKVNSEDTSAAIPVIAVVLAVVMIFMSVVSIGGTMMMSQNSGGENTGTVCTAIADAAENELRDADYTVGGYRYKNWYGMDDNWCAMFVSYCADQCGFIEAGIMPKTASVAAMKQWYINRNQFQSSGSGYEPKAGDIIIFGNGMSHTGIVTGYDPATKTVTTIEGNSGRSSTTPYHKGSHVKEHHYSLSYAKIAGYGTPDYPEETITDKAEGEQQ